MKSVTQFAGRARYAGLTGALDESGSKRREKGLAKAATHEYVAG
jgi:hypothetical protein